jgi:tetratricopeptide (TPR) repeat protein
VSLKFLSKDLTRDDERKQRFMQEARAAAAIQHPHIAAVHDIDEADGRTFIAMEYIPGQSLRELIEAGKLNLRRSLELGFQISDGLAKAHERGVVHRDIKPENILVSEDGYAKIIDFGLAKLLEPFVPGAEAPEETETKLKTKEGLVMGTISYMSPEQARGDAIDARTDIFSFGVVLYEMLAGNSPFRKKSLAESMSAVLNETPPALKSSATLQPDVRRVLKKAMAKELTERYQSMKDLAIDLKELREELLSTSREAAPALAANKFPWQWVAVAAVALLGIVVGWAFFGRDTAPPGIGETGRPAVAVMYFESMSGDEEVRWLSKGLPNMLITNLAQTPGLDVVSSQRIQKILKDIGEEDLESIDLSLVDEVARKAGAGAVVVGSIFKSGDNVRIDVQLQDVGTGRVLSAESVQGQDVFPLVDELTGRIRASLDLGDQPNVRPVADVTTPSLEAFQLYSEGLEARRAMRRADARELEHLDRLPERQKLLVQARFAQLLEGNLEEAAELLENLISQYPDEEDAYHTLTRVYSRLNQFDKSLNTRERGVKALPRSGILRNDYAYALVARGRYPEAIRQFETYVELSPNEANPYDSLAEAYLIMGQPEQALERYARALEVDPSLGAIWANRAWAFAMLGRFDEALAERDKGANSADPYFPPTTFAFMDAYTLSRQGRYREAEQRLREGLELAAGQGNLIAQVSVHQLSALLAFERENYDESIKGMDLAEELNSQLPSPNRNASLTAYLFGGATEVRRGNLKEAQQHLEALAESYDPADQYEKWVYEALRGEIALATGDLDAAESAFMEGEPELKMGFSAGNPVGSLFANHLPFRDGLVRVKRARGDPAGAIEIYRKLNKPDVANKWTTMFEPRYVLEVARLLDGSGDKEAARKEYERFLEFWKDADEGLPELKEARAYVAQ